MFSKARFEKAITKGGFFKINDGEVNNWWIGQDGNFWVEYYFPRTYQKIAMPVAKHDERF